MTVKVESFTAKVKRYLRVIVLISSQEKEMGAYAIHACHDNRPVIDIHHISHKSQWTKPALTCSKQRLSNVLPKAFFIYQRRACYQDRHSFSWDEIKTITLKLRLTFAAKDSTLNVISYHCG